MAKIYNLLKIYLLIFFLLLYSIILLSQETRQLATDKPRAVADLKTTEGASLVNAKWFVQQAHIVDAVCKLPVASANDALHLYPTGAPVKTHTIHPQISAPDFENGFVPIKPTDLEMREGMGLVSMAWYKVDLTIPVAIGKLNTDGTTAIFEVVMDDYSEIWVNGKQARGFGQSGNGVIPGFNARNRVILSEHAKSGDHFSIAILGINGPLGMIPDNYIWIRNAVIDFYKDGIPVPAGWNDVGKIYTIDESLNSIISPGTKIEKIADGFAFTEGPVWHPDGYLLFSDPNTNTIYRYNPQNHNVTVYMSHSGYTGADIGDYEQPGSNGLAIDREGRLIIDQHGNRRVVRIEKKGPVTILADKIDGYRFNSPNDIVVKSDGSIYFTDPPYGLPGLFNDKRKELNYSGVFLIKNGKTIVVSKTLADRMGWLFHLTKNICMSLTGISATYTIQKQCGDMKYRQMVC